MQCGAQCAVGFVRRRRKVKKGGRRDSPMEVLLRQLRKIRYLPIGEIHAKTRGFFGTTKRERRRVWLVPERRRENQFSTVSTCTVVRVAGRPVQGGEGSRLIAF